MTKLRRSRVDTQVERTLPRIGEQAPSPLEQQTQLGLGVRRPEVSNDPAAPVDVLGDLHGRRARTRRNPSDPRHAPERRAPISASTRPPSSTSPHVSDLRPRNPQLSDRSQVAIPRMWHTPWEQSTSPGTTTSRAAPRCAARTRSSRSTPLPAGHRRQWPLPDRDGRDEDARRGHSVSGLSWIRLVPTLIEVVQDALSAGRTSRQAPRWYEPGPCASNCLTATGNPTAACLVPQLCLIFSRE